MVEEPPRPCPPGSETSAISFCISKLISRAILPSDPPSTAQAQSKCARRSRCACHGASEQANPSSFANSAATALPCSPSDARVPDAPPNCRINASAKEESSLLLQRYTAPSHPAAFSPNVIGGAPCIKGRPSITVFL